MKGKSRMDTIVIRNSPLSEKHYKAVRPLHYYEQGLSSALYRWLLQNKSKYLLNSRNELDRVFVQYGSQVEDYYTSAVFEMFTKQYPLIYPEDFLTVYKAFIQEYTTSNIYEEQKDYLVKYTPHTEYNYSQDRANAITMYVANEIREACLVGLPALLLAFSNEGTK